MKGRTRKQQLTAIAGIIVGVFAISIGFAAFSSTLNIRSSATVNPDASSFAVIFSNDGNNIDATQTVNPSSDTYGDKATITNGTSPVIGGLKAKFTAPGQSVSYSFYAKNTGSFDAYLNYITFLNAEGSTSNKICTAQEGTDQTLVDSACNGISISVKVGNDAAVTTSQAGITNHILGKNTKEQVIVTITYAENSAVADGAFDVTFGDISLIYSTVSDFVVEGPKGPICKPVEVATTGNVPQGNYQQGDEYTCNVKDDVWYTFFVVGTEGDYVNLLMYSNINDDGVPVDSDEVANKGLVAWNESGNLTEGPVTAIEYLNRATSTWDNIDNLNEEFSEVENINTTNNYTIQLTGKARLISEFELQQNTEYVFDYLADINGPHTNSVSGVPGYWIMNTWYGELATYVTDQGTQTGDDVGNNPTYGVRPVIKVAISDIVKK